MQIFKYNFFIYLPFWPMNKYNKYDLDSCTYLNLNNFYSPEKNLLIAILARALGDLFSKDQVDHRTALQFFESKEEEAYGSFRFITAHLGLSPEPFIKFADEILCGMHTKEWRLSVSRF